MAQNDESLNDDLIEACKRVGISLLQSWLQENEIELPNTQENNFFASLNEGLQQETITADQLSHAIAELEENSNKKIYLYQLQDSENFLDNTTGTLRRFRVDHGILKSDKNYVVKTPTARPTFVYMYIDEGNSGIKIKYTERHFNLEADYEKEGFIKTPIVVVIVFVIDLLTGIVQLRLDSPGNIHSHKNDEGKSTEAVYEQYYKALLIDLCQGSQLQEMNLNGVASYIANTEKDRFRINRGVTTITNNAKQTFASASIRQDVRDLPEYEAAEAKGGNVWQAEDLTGYWLANQSNQELKKDLFMRISRRTSQIRVQRGCLEKELNYGIRQIREIQEKI